MKNKKISIIGVGCVGATIAYSIMLKNLADEVVLIDINKEQIESEILDIKEGSNLLPIPIQEIKFNLNSVVFLARYILVVIVSIASII